MNIPDAEKSCEKLVSGSASPAPTAQGHPDLMLPQASHQQPPETNHNIQGVPKNMGIQ